MKVRIGGQGELAPAVREYLTIGKVYEATEHPLEGLFIVEGDGALSITVNMKYPFLCGHIHDAIGDLYWEVVE